MEDKWVINSLGGADLVVLWVKGLLLRLCLVLGLLPHIWLQTSAAIPQDNT